jgi:hypothetical protein
MCRGTVRRRRRPVTSPASPVPEKLPEPSRHEVAEELKSDPEGERARSCVPRRRSVRREGKRETLLRLEFGWIVFFCSRAERDGLEHAPADRGSALPRKRSETEGRTWICVRGPLFVGGNDRRPREERGSASAGLCSSAVMSGDRETTLAPRPLAFARSRSHSKIERRARLRVPRPSFASSCERRPRDARGAAPVALRSLSVSIEDRGASVAPRPLAFVRPQRSEEGSGTC